MANSAIVALSADGAIDLYSSSAVQVIVDVTGVFVPVAGNVSSGRFVAVPPSRLVDTRRTADRRSGDLVVPIPPGVPSDATALAVSVTLTDTDEADLRHRVSRRCRSAELERRQHRSARTGAGGHRARAGQRRAASPSGGPRRPT